jgi:hypothetical protein
VKEKAVVVETVFIYFLSAMKEYSEAKKHHIIMSVVCLNREFTSSCHLNISLRDTVEYVSPLT